MGKVEMTDQFLLEWLDFSGGVVVDVRKADNYSYGTICFIIAHPDMPEIKEGGAIPVVNVTTTETVDGEDFVPRRTIERTNPPKRKK